MDLLNFEGYPSEGYPKDAYPPPGYPPQGYPPQQGYPQQGYPPPPVYAPQYQQPPPQQQSSSVGCLEGWYVSISIYNHASFFLFLFLFSGIIFSLTQIRIGFWGLERVNSPRPPPPLHVVLSCLVLSHGFLFFGESSQSDIFRFIDFVFIRTLICKEKKKSLYLCF